MNEPARGRVVSILLAEDSPEEPEAVRQAIASLPGIAAAHFLKPDSPHPRLRRLLYAHLAPDTELAAALDSMRALPGVASADPTAERHLLST